MDPKHTKESQLWVLTDKTSDHPRNTPFRWRTLSLVIVLLFFILFIGAVVYTVRLRMPVEVPNPSLLPISKETQLNPDDFDGDGLSNNDEVTWKTDPHVFDTDGDGRPDGEEVRTGTNPARAESTSASPTPPSPSAS